MKRKLVVRNGTTYIPLYQKERFFFDINEDEIEIEFRKTSKKIVISAVKSNKKEGA